MPVSSPVEWKDDSSEPSKPYCFRETQGLTADEVQAEASLGRAGSSQLHLIVICREPRERSEQGRKRPAGDVSKSPPGTSLAVQWLGHHTFTAKGPGSIPG